MGGWVTWVVMLIALVIWILANLAKTPQNKPPPGRRPQPPRLDGGPAGRPATRPPTDLDRFIEEARRRREDSQRNRSSSVPPPLPPRTEQPKPPPLPRARPAPPAPRPLPGQARTYERIPVLTEVPVSVPPERPGQQGLAGTGEPTAASTDGFTAPPVGQTTQSAYATRTRFQRMSSSAVARQVTQMLQDPNSARVALLLREILDRPISQRRGRR